jgi:hypothetical protein
LESLNLTQYCAAFKDNGVDGEVLIGCETYNEVIGLGMPKTEAAFAKKLLRNIDKFIVSGVPLELLSKVTYRCRFLETIRLKLYFLYLQGSLQVPDIIDCDKITIGNAFDGDGELSATYPVIMDSGATNTMLPSKKAFRKLDCKKNLVNAIMPDSSNLVVKGVGYSYLDILGKCYYVPRLIHGLISISQLTKDRTLKNIVEGGKSKIIDEKGQVLLSATERGGLYYLDDKYCNILYDNQVSNFVVNALYIMVMKMMPMR